METEGTGSRRRAAAGRARRALAAFALALALPAAAVAATYTWTGGGADANWSDDANWGGAGPSDGELGASLMFPALAGHYASHNDLTGLHVNFLGVATQLSDGDYAFSGNPFRLEGPATFASPGTGAPNLLWQIPLALGANVTLAASGRQTQLRGDIDLGPHTLTLNAGGDIVLAGVVSGAGSLVKNNTSAVTITGANTYGGTTTSNSGALYLATAAALGAAGAGTTIAGGFLGFSPGSAFTLSEPLRFTGGGIGAYGDPRIAGPITLDVPITARTYEAATTLTIAGAVAGAGGLTKAGPGVLRLTGTATYAGATGVDAGYLHLDGSLAGGATTTVRPGATLLGIGSSAGPISVEAGGTLQPGNSPGALACGGLAMVAGATLAVELTGATPAVEYDQLRVDGPVSLGGATLAVTLAFAPADGQTFTLIDQQPAQAVNGTFDGLAEGGTVALQGTTLGITYVGGSGNDVVLITSPENPTATPTAGAPAPSPTPTPTAVAACAGDCDGNGAVGINELVTGVNVALGNDSVDACPAFDVDADGAVAIQELIAAVNNALGGCRSL